MLSYGQVNLLMPFPRHNPAVIDDKSLIFQKISQEDLSAQSQALQNLNDQYKCQSRIIYWCQFFKITAEQTTDIAKKINICRKNLTLFSENKQLITHLHLLVFPKN